MSKLFDIHSHLHLPDFDKDQEDVIREMQENKIWTIVVGINKKTSKDAVKLAEKYNNIFACIGLHPNDNDNNIDYEYDNDFYRNLAQHPKVVAIGETGLDYYRNLEAQNIKSETRNKQIKIFKQQIELALEINKPLMIHCRNAHNEVLDIISKFKIQDSRLRGNIHFFSGDWNQAQKYFDFGFSISFAGVITFVRNYDEIIKKAPLDKIMIETDAPFVTPEPYRRQRNKPLYVAEIAKKIAEIRKISYEEIAEITTKNALKFFNIT